MSHLGHPRADLPPPRPPVEPPPSRWSFPPATSADEHGVVGVGADLEPGTLLAAYRAGLFPMPVGRSRLTRASPGGRPTRGASCPLDGLRVSRSLRKSCAPLRRPGRHRVRGR